MILDLREYLKKIRDYIEGTPLIIILTVTAIFALSWVADLFGIINYIQESSTNIIYLGAFLIYLLSLVVNLVIIFRLRNFRKSYIDLENQKAAISNILLQAATLNTPSYALKKWHEKYEIFENGDAKYTRRVIIKYINSPVQWFEFSMRLIEGHKISSIEELGIHVYTITKNGRRGEDLIWAVPLASRERIRTVVLLHPPVKRNFPMELEFTLFWRGLFRPLIVNNIDNCAIDISRPTEDIKIELISPENYRFTELTRTNSVGDYIIGKTRDGKSRLQFTIDKMSKQKIDYWVSWEEVISKKIKAQQ